ncbi:phosphotransferase family protein [Blastococcus sp. URHD0036]|uniref:phosphotransferase family protein n=1 Tax=Blastococcus sp. URHD0036 TaxID=1380356 RepID=UPI00049804F0|nr:phosphotransferase family protein [Blastococcus sp. URHD0036]
MTGPSRALTDDELTAALVPVERLQAYLADVVAIDEPPTVKRITIGHSNEMFRVSSGSSSWMLRRPPRVTSGRPPVGFEREYRVISALRDSDVPHARVVAYCTDEAVIGAPFLLQEWVHGFAPRLPLPEPFTDDAAAQRELTGALVDGLAALGRFDWRAAGLGDLGRPDGFLERQADRWLAQLDRYRTRELPHVGEIAEWLRTHVPTGSRPGLMHGDYTWSNVMCAHGRPGRLAAIVDWELATIGDPLLDLGWLIGLWQEPGEPAEGRDPSTLFCSLPGQFTRRELIERYAKGTDRPLEDVDYYQVLALFKVSCLVEGSWARYARGQSDDPGHASFEHRVPTLLNRAARIAGLV